MHPFHLRFSQFGRRWVLLGLLAALTSGSLAGDTPPPDADQEKRKILMRWIDAVGGAYYIQQLKCVDYHCVMNFGAGLPSIDTYVRATSTGTYRYDYELPNFGRLTQAFDGESAWQKNDELGFGPLSAEEHVANLGGIDFRAPLRIGSLFPGMSVLPSETIDGRKLAVLAVKVGSEVSSKWYFDAETGLRVRIDVAAGDKTIVIEFSDFHRVHGVQEPYRIVRRSAGGTVEIKMLSVLYNEPTDPLLFSPPAAWLDDNRRIQQVLSHNRVLTGSDVIQDVQTRVTKGTVEVTTSNLKISMTTYQKRPNLIVVEQEAPGSGIAKQGFDGKIGWAWSELEGYRTMQGAELMQMQGSADLAGTLRLSALCPLRRLLDDKEFHGRPAIGIGLASARGPAGNFYFDLRTGYLIGAETFAQVGANGQIKVVEEYADFRRIDGIYLPFVTTVTNPAMRSVMRIESVVQNVPLDDVIFQPKKSD